MDITHLLLFWVTRSLPDGVREEQIVVGNPNLNTQTLNSSKKSPQSLRTRLVKPESNYYERIGIHINLNQKVSRIKW